MPRPASYRPLTPRRANREPVVPMINVVFLLLIFFLMTAQITPPEPFEMRLPDAPRSAPAAQAQPLYLSARGDLAYGAARGEVALLAAAAAGPVRLHAHRSASGAELASILTRLSVAGARDIHLVTQEADNARD